MRFLKQRKQFDFMGMRFFSLGLSAALVFGSVVSLINQGLNLGVDFTGGTLIEMGFRKPIDLSALRGTLTNSQFVGATAQHFGTPNEVLIRIAPQKDGDATKLGEEVLMLLRTHDQSLELRRIEFVGPQIGKELTEDGGLAILYALLGILIYIAIRFQLRFSVGAITALSHDLLLVFGIFSVTQWEFDLTVLAALLAVVGYSLNDTIVVFDRIRESFLKARKQSTPAEVINLALNATLSRTIMTSLTTLLVLVALFFFGGEIIHRFAIALICGVLIGTYSSIFIASPITLLCGVNREDLLPAVKEGADQAPLF